MQTRATRSHVLQTPQAQGPRVGAPASDVPHGAVADIPGVAGARPHNMTFQSLYQHGFKRVTGHLIDTACMRNFAD